MWHSWLLLFALSVGLVPVAFGDDHLCFETGNCYTVNTTALTFYDAKMACGVKGVLASMKNQHEMEELKTFVSQLQDQRNINKFWLGLYLPACITKDKDLYGFVWVSGENTTEVTGWKNIPKSLCTRKKCVILETTKDRSTIGPSVTLVWKNVKCKQNFPSICRYSESKQALPSKGMEVVTQTSTDHSKIQTSFSDQYTTHTSITTQHAEVSSSTSQVNVPCNIFVRNVTSACTLIISYACNATHCSCRNMNDSTLLYMKCNNLLNISCQQLCTQSMNISCSCNYYYPCEEDECTTDLLSSPKSPVSSSTNLDSARSTSAPVSDDDNLLDRLIIPLILGLVAFGILVMLVWGGVQMCIRKRKPKRRKSIAPAPPEASDTDSTDHSSSEEEEDNDDEGDRESCDRTEDP